MSGSIHKKTVNQTFLPRSVALKLPPMGKIVWGLLWGDGDWLWANKNQSCINKCNQIPMVVMALALFMNWECFILGRMGCFSSQILLVLYDPLLAKVIKLLSLYVYIASYKLSKRRLCKMWWSATNILKAGSLNFLPPPTLPLSPKMQ